MSLSPPKQTGPPPEYHGSVTDSVQDLTKADESALAELGRLVPMYEELALSSKVNLIQSLVSRLLVELVFEAYFVGLSTDLAHQFTQMETFLASFGTSRTHS